MVRHAEGAADLRDPEQSKSMVGRVMTEFDALHLVVDNAAVIHVTPLLDVTPNDWDFVNDINARGLFFALQAGAQQM
jgi:NAD(P)-dependent dehydrogenase (short-subunit alcohol dehydrogenase family)